MRSIAAVLAGVGALALAAPYVAAQSRFEGTITFRTMDDNGKTDTLVQTTKGHATKIEQAGLGAYIVDGDQHQIAMIDPRQKRYMVMTDAAMQQMRAMGEQMRAKYGQKGTTSGGDSGDDEQINFSDTGRKETVAGTSCEVWHGYRIEDGVKKEGEACIANGVGLFPFDAMSSPMSGEGRRSKAIERYRKILGPNGGVLKVVEIKDGKPITAIEAIRIDRTPVSATAFQAPAGYTKVDMGEQMMKMHQMQQRSQEHAPAAKPPTR